MARAQILIGTAMLGLATQAFGQSTYYLKLFDDGFQFQICSIIPYGSASRTNGSLGTGSVILDTVQYNSGFGPLTAPSPDFAPDSAGLYWACTQHWWWYRGTGDTREYALSNQTAFSQSSPDTVTMTYSEPVAGVPNALRFDFTYTLVGQSSGPDTAMVTVDWTITNTSAASQNVAFYSYTDLNAGGLPGINNDAWSYTSFPAYSEYRVNDTPTTSSPFVTTGAIGPVTAQNTRWGCNLTSPTFTRTSLTNTSINDANQLSSTSWPLTATGGAWSGSIEWTTTLAAGDSVSGKVYIGYNDSYHPCTADIAGLGGTLGADGQITVDDLVMYLGRFFASDIAVADIAGFGGTPGPDGQITVDDLVIFLSRFFAGC